MGKAGSFQARRSVNFPEILIKGLIFIKLYLLVALQIFLLVFLGEAANLLS